MQGDVVVWQSVVLQLNRQGDERQRGLVGGSVDLGAFACLGKAGRGCVYYV